MRWFALAIILLLVALNWKNIKKHKWNGIIEILVPFCEGMVGGLIIDAVAFHFNFYNFPRQPAYSLNYWLVVVPCWGVFGLVINSLWDRFGGKWWRAIIFTTLPLLLFYESSNLITQSWLYNVSFGWVVLGWTPLVLVFAGCRRRRRVVFRFDVWIKSYQGETVMQTAEET